MSHSRQPGRLLAVLFPVVFFDLLGLVILIPVQPFFAESLGATPTLVTLVASTFFLAQLLFGPIWGWLSDRIGRRPVMLLTIGTGVAGHLLFALSRNLLCLFVARALAGISSANVGTAQAIIADATPEERRARGMGLIGAAFGLAFIIGPALGGIFGQLGLAAPAYAAAATAALNWIFVLCLLPETHRRDKSLRRMPRWTWPPRWSPMVLRLFSLYFVVTLAYALMEQVLGLFIERAWGATRAVTLTSSVLVVFGIALATTQGLLIGRGARRFGERYLVVAGCIAIAASYCLIPICGRAGSFVALMADSIFMAVGMGLTTPSLSSLLSRAVSVEARGEALGTGQALTSAARVVGPAISGALFQRMVALPFWLGAALLTVCAALGATLPPEPKRSRFGT